jgi:hypothetical protein
MREKPIIFSTPMVRAILEECKTQTRRVVLPQPKYELRAHKNGWYEYSENPLADPVCNSPWGTGRVPKYAVGDILWVRETWQENTIHSEEDKREKPYLYKADPDGVLLRSWKPSIFMPREAARLFLEVKSVRVERLWDISEKDAAAEGTNQHCHCKYHAVKNPPIGCMPNETHKFIDCVKCRFYNTTSFKAGFLVLWNSIYAKRGYSWDSNPWVEVIGFERIKP